MGMGSFGSGSPTTTQHQLSSSFTGDSVIEGNLLIAGNLGVSGSFGLGTSTPSVGSTKGLDIENTTASSATEGGAIRLGCNDGAVMASGHRLGVIEFAGAEDTSSTMTVGARIEALCDATWSASENGAALLFYTTDGNASQSEQMRILAGGNVGIGVADPDTKLEVGGKIHISGETTTPSQPAGGDGGILYVKADGKLYWRSNEIAEVDISSGGGSGTITALNNQAESRLVSIGSTTTELDGEAGLTFASSILSLTADASALKFGVDNDVTFTHDNGTGMDITSAGNLDIDCTAGSVTLGASLTDGQTLKLGKNGAVETIIAPHGTAGSEKYTVTNTAGTAADAIGLTSTAGGITLTTAAAGVVLAGTTPKLTIGDAGTEDTMLAFDGNAQDYYMALVDAQDTLSIGVGTTAGTNSAITVNSSAQVQIIDAFAANTAGTFGTFADGDATPSVATGNLWKHHASTQTITMFDDGLAGQTIHVISTAAITYDVTSTNLKGGSTDIVTASGDITSWFFDGTNWYLVQFMDVSADHSSIGGGGGGAFGNTLQTKTAGYTVADGDGVILCDSNTGTTAFTITLPTSGLTEGMQFVIKDSGGGAATYNITIDPQTKTIDGSTTDIVISTNYASVTLVVDSSHNYWIM